MPVDTNVEALRITEFTLGEAIRDRRMWVDTYQRNYAWRPEHVRDLYEDFERTIKQGPPAEHFLGSIVVVSDGSRAKIVDGQQRLSTTTILFAAMRDYFYRSGSKQRAQAYENGYLTTINVDTLKPEPHLLLNTVDHSLFQNRVLLGPDEPDRLLEESKEPTLPSHQLICQAVDIAKEQVKKIVNGLNSQQAEERLTQWKDFIIQRARVIWFIVPDDGTAYSVFETMNDRGLRLSATDLLKNLLFALSKEQAYSHKVQENWFKMAAILEASNNRDAVLNYVRHFWISSRTKATTNDLYKTIKREIQSKDDALTFSQQLHTTAIFYAALLNSEHKLWNEYPAQIKEDVKTLNKLNLVTVRPLILSGIECFKEDHSKLRDFFRSLVNWSIRFLIAGKLGGGALEERYGDVARKIAKGKLTSIKDIREDLADIIPTNDAFSNLFQSVTVSTAALQKYYLRTLEKVARQKLGIDDLGPVDLKVSIEHIMPKGAKKSYKHLQPETRKAYLNRLGNLALMNAKDNEKAGDEEYQIKRSLFEKSNMVLTAAIAKEYESWGTIEIVDRQKKLAALALEAWPITVGGVA